MCFHVFRGSLLAYCSSRHELSLECSSSFFPSADMVSFTSSDSAAIFQKKIRTTNAVTPCFAGRRN